MIYLLYFAAFVACWIVYYCLTYNARQKEVRLMVLFGILKAGQLTRAVPVLDIYHEIKAAGVDLPIATIYTAILSLEEDGLITTTQGAGYATRNYRPTCLCTLTPKGMQATMPKGAR